MIIKKCRFKRTKDSSWEYGVSFELIGTGKGGYIQFKLAVEREFRKQLKNNNPKSNEV
jgi:hypothetical protein